MRKKIGVLQVASGLTAGTSGGVAAFIVNYCKEMDTALVGCDFLAIGYQCFVSVKPAVPSSSFLLMR